MNEDHEQNAAISQGRPDASSRWLARPGEMILVVEDDHYLRRVVVRTLENWGFAISEAPDGAKALEQMATVGESVSLMLLDIMLPILNGVEVARRTLNDRPQTCILACSAAMTESLIEELQRVGVRDFLMKPYTADSLKEAVNRALQSSREPTHQDE